jgi:hypothetical protein
MIKISVDISNLEKQVNIARQRLSPAQRAYLQEHVIEPEMQRLYNVRYILQEHDLGGS